MYFNLRNNKVKNLLQYCFITLAPGGQGRLRKEDVWGQSMASCLNLSFCLNSVLFLLCSFSFSFLLSSYLSLSFLKFFFISFFSHLFAFLFPFSFIGSYISLFGGEDLRRSGPSSKYTLVEYVWSKLQLCRKYV